MPASCTLERKRMNHSELEQVFTRISESEADAVKLMQDIIPIKALGPTNGGQGEADKAEFFKQYLKNMGITDIQEFHTSSPENPEIIRPNLVAKIPGKNPAKTVWILAHTDVVPEGDLSKWDSDPFEAVVTDGKIFGRGTEDNNQGAVSGIITMRAFVKEGILPEYNLGVVLVADEETGSAYGLQYLVDEHADIFGKDDIIIVPDAGEPDSSMIEVAEKSIMWIKIKTLGHQVHASTPDRGINAHKAAAWLTVQFERLHELFAKNDPVFDPPISTFEPTKKEPNVPNINTLPGEDIFYLDCRILPDYSIENVMKEVRKMADETEKKYNVTIELSTEQEEQAAPATPVDAPVVKALEEAISKVYDIKAKPMGIGGGTVAAIFRRAGFDAAVWSTLDDLAHQPNEYCKISNLINDAKVFAHVCLQK